MTFEELKKSVKELKYSCLSKIMGYYCSCNLFDGDFSTTKKSPYLELYVKKNNDIWEVYSLDCGRGILEAKFTSEDILYEYIYCCYKKISDY